MAHTPREETTTMNDETMDELAAEPRYVSDPEGERIVELQAETQPLRGIVSCLMCGDLMHGLTRSEAAEDALRIGWEYRTPGGWRCPACLDEEAAL